MEPGGTRAGRPPRLSREAILRSAERILLEEGAEHLSMRRLAKELRSTPMALYHHVRNKDELLLLLLEMHTGEPDGTELPREPRERLLAAARSLRETLANSPWAAAVLAPDARVSASTGRLVTAMVDAAVACGLDRERAVHAYRVIWHYTLGELLVRRSRERARRQDGDTPWERAVRSLDPDVHPVLARCGGRLAEDATTSDYRRGLEAIVDGLLRPGAARPLLAPPRD
ncbi:TetR/AcrR family transcriptional regulator [Streptomyces californicus]|uniref:TetR/AcrR family transcriptional regulator n=1 Tax=Streptomyces californicus TaxID=67351 RepID=UPI00379AE822